MPGPPPGPGAGGVAARAAAEHLSEMVGEESPDARAARRLADPGRPPGALTPP
jgi:hypothetical protein